HMSEPLKVMQNIHSLLNHGGYLLIRIPVADCYAWEHYRTNWVQLDAPRHFFLHTTKSMQTLSEQAGFVLEDVVHDSWELQFWGSEKYKKDLPLTDKTFTFTNEEMLAFKTEAQKLNAAKKGDQACFYFKKN
ncbi:MAG: methyltransferase domain-containing protein, partial [Bacteroidota bacterium]